MNGFHHVVPGVAEEAVYENKQAVYENKRAVERAQEAPGENKVAPHECINTHWSHLL